MQTYNVDLFPPTFITTDLVIFRKNKATFDVLLIQRAKDPFQNCWALPGGYFDVDLDATIEDGAVRELKEETNLNVSKSDLKFVGLFSNRHRDPREKIANKKIRILSAAFKLKTELEPHSESLKSIQAMDDAKNIKWFHLDALPDLAFDHAEIIKKALI